MAKRPTKPKMPEKKKLYAHILLDRSGSMEGIRDKTIDAVNEYINGLAMDDALDSRISLTLFDSGVMGQGDIIQTVIDAKPVKDALKVTRDTYAPRGGTPLNDAIGKVVAKIDGTTLSEGENVALVILTDGQENASKEYTKDTIKALLDGRQKDKNWLVIYLGANQDAFAEGDKYGTQTANTMNWSTQNSGQHMNSSLRATRSYGLTGSVAAAAFTEDERKAAIKPEVKP